MSAQSIALASLTATYTDSEGEDGFDDDFNDNAKTMETSCDSQSRVSTSPGLDQLTMASPKVSSEGGSGSRHYSNSHGITIARTTESFNKVQPLLVSYHDDTVISDDEGGIPVTPVDAPQPVENGVAIVTTATPAASPGESPSNPPVVSDDDENNAYGVTIPPEPPGPCPPELQEKITKFHQRMLGEGLDMNKVIQERKDFRNPSIYEKLIQYCGINELGTNYSPDRFDPFKWGKDSYYEDLALVQKAEMDKLEKARKEKTKCEIVSGTVKRSSSLNANEEEAKRRKSKWDQVASGTVAPVKPTVLLPHPTLTTLTASATGTKTTVISAFGSLPKKRL